MARYNCSLWSATREARQKKMIVRSIWLVPFLTFILSLLAFLVSYCLAVVNKHVSAFWPYISDGGAMSPESCVFGQLTNMAAFLLAMTVYLRHRQVMEFYYHHLQHDRKERRAWRIYSNIFLWIGFGSAFGCSIVANFQEINVIVMHYIGAFMSFGLGLIYCWAQTIFSYLMNPQLTSRWLCHFRAFLSLTSMFTFILFTVFMTMATAMVEVKNPSCEGHLYIWSTDDPNYYKHTIATISEWVMASAFQLYILSFAAELRNAYCEAPKLKFYPGRIAPAPEYPPPKITTIEET